MSNPKNQSRWRLRKVFHLRPAEVALHLRSADMGVYPAPRIEGATRRHGFRSLVRIVLGPLVRFLVVSIIIVRVVVVVVLMRGIHLAVVRLHVYSAVEIAVRLLEHGLSDRNSRIAERHGKRVIACRDLRRAPLSDGADRQRKRSRRKRGARGCRGEPAHTRFLFRTSAASARHTPE